MELTLEERLLRVETNMAHLEHLCEQLNQVVTDQNKVIARLQAMQQKLSTAVEGQELDRIKATNSKPPHYSI